LIAPLIATVNRLQEEPRKLDGCDMRSSTPSNDNALRPLRLPTEGLAEPAAVVKLLPFPDLSAQYPTGSLLAVAGVWTPEMDHLVAR
jgi:hypothetical protein